MNNLFAMRRANGDWYALDDRGSDRVPVFQSSKAAMTARSQDPRMECFRAVEIGEEALLDFTSSGDPGFLLVTDPLRKLNRGQLLDHTQLTGLIRNGHSLTKG